MIDEERARPHDWIMEALDGLDMRDTEALEEFSGLVLEALAAERERCAEAVLRMGGSVNDGFTLEDCAATIRALGESSD